MQLWVILGMSAKEISISHEVDFHSEVKHSQENTFVDVCCTQLQTPENGFEIFFHKVSDRIYRYRFFKMLTRSPLSTIK